MGVRHQSILAVSPDRELTEFRHGTLTQAGFYVISVRSEAAARYEINFGRCGALLLCHKLSRQAREALATDFHMLCPEPFIVAILAHADDHFPPQTHVCLVHSDDLLPLVRAFSEKLAA